MCQDVSVVTRPYTGVSAERRLQDRRRQLLDAAVGLMCEYGVGNLTIRNVAAAAGLSPRYIYESFEDLDDLRLRTLDDIATEVVGRLVAAVLSAAPDLRSQARAAVTALIAYADEEPNRARLGLTGSYGDPALTERRHTMARTLSASVAEYARPHVPDRVTDQQLALAARMAFGAMAELIVARLDGEEITADTVVAEEMLDLVVDALDAFGVTGLRAE